MRDARSEAPQAASAALGKLCQTYWGPVNVYIRQRGHSPADADDLTQQFFARFLAKGLYRLADPERGRFRTFLLTLVKRFLINEWEGACAQKRGGGQVPVSLDEVATEDRLPAIELKDERTAQWAFDRSWALTLLARVRDRLESDYAAEGKRDRFLQLEKFLPGEESGLTYAEAATRFGVAEGTIKSDVHRLKRRYRDLLVEEIKQTVGTRAEVEEELRYLIRALGQPQR